MGEGGDLPINILILQGPYRPMFFGYNNLREMIFNLSIMCKEHGMGGRGWTCHQNKVWIKCSRAWRGRLCSRVRE